MEVIVSSGFTARGNTSVRLVIEGLLAHFFSADRPIYDSEDALWFLELANKQKQNINQVENNSEVEPAAKTSVSFIVSVQGHLFPP